MSLKKLTQNDWERIIKTIIFILTGIFIFIVTVIATDSVRDVGLSLTIGSVFAYFLLGLALLILTLKRKIKGSRVFLVGIGGSLLYYIKFPLRDQ